jgi:hypothetical protein
MPKHEPALKHWPERPHLPRTQDDLEERELGASGIKIGLARTDARKENRAREFVSRASLGVLSMGLNFMVN